MKEDISTQSSTKDTTKSPTKKFRKRLKIMVTQKEIDEALKADSKHCMIQRALERDHPEFKRIWVDKNQLRCTDPEQNCIYTFEMSPRARVMLLRWDAGEMVKPMEIWLRNPIVRERVEIGKDGVARPKSQQQTAKRHRGPIPRPKTKEERLRTGRDRVFGKKQWTKELAQIRETLGVPPPSS